MHLVRVENSFINLEKCKEQVKAFLKTVTSILYKYNTTILIKVRVLI